MIKYELDHITSYSAKLGAPEIIGPVPEGIRMNVYVESGEVKGPRIRGRLLQVGGDWLTVRRDGVAVLDVRGTMETHDGAKIYVTYSGIIDFGENGYEEALRGNLVPNGTPIRVSPRMSTSHPDYLWLNRLHFLGIGQTVLDRMEVEYDVYAVR